MMRRETSFILIETNLTHAERVSEELVEACLASIVSDSGPLRRSGSEASRRAVLRRMVG